MTRTAAGSALSGKHPGEEAFALDGLGGPMIQIRDLSLIPRILFATDGGITHILEAYAGERMELVRLTSSMVTDFFERQQLGLDRSERALRRCSLLRGAASGRAFIHANSVVALDRLPEQAARELLHEGTSLLLLLARNRIGTFREGIAEWEGHDPHVSEQLAIPEEEILLGRTYHILSGGRPIAWVTEHFPKGGFALTPPPGGVPAGAGAHRSGDQR